MRTASRIAALAALLGLAACSSTTAPAPELLLRVQLDRAEVEPGGDVSVLLVARNETSNTVTLEPGGCTPLDFEVVRADGTFVGPTGPHVCVILDGPPPLRLEPGDSLAVSHRWSAIWGYTRGGGSGGRQLAASDPDPGTPLEPGTYTVRPLLLERGEWRRAGSTMTLRVRAPGS